MPPMIPKSRNPRNGVTASDRYATPAVAAAAAVARIGPCDRARASHRGGLAGPPFLQIPAQQDDAEVDAVADDDRGQEGAGDVQVPDGQRRQREGHQGADRQRPSQRQHRRRGPEIEQQRHPAPARIVTTVAISIPCTSPRCSASAWTTSPATPNRTPAPVPGAVSSIAVCRAAVSRAPRSRSPL